MSKLVLLIYVLILSLLPTWSSSTSSSSSSSPSLSPSPIVTASPNTNPPSTSTNPTTVPIDVPKDKIYELNLSQWHIYNDNSHAQETTDGLNNALIWARDAGFTVFKVPAGTYLIAKGTDGTWDSRGRINMVSDMTFWLDDKAIIQKETNGYEGYSTLFIGVGVQNVQIIGGTYRGDRETHDYSSGGTHESGYGILAKGAFNVTIDGVKALNFTGDGLCVGGGNGTMQDLYEKSFESGSIDDNGNQVTSASKIRTKTSWQLTHPSYNLTNTLIIDNGQHLPAEYDIYFYKADGSFLTKLKQQGQGKYISIPEGGHSIRLVFNSTLLKDQYLEIWNRVQSTNIVVQNSESSFNRRQGLTINGGKNVTVQNSIFHDIGGKKGTAPMAGIDVEGGAGENGYINENISIKNNKFYNNSRYDVIFYDGHNGILENNHLASRGVIGLAVSEPFTGAVIKNNNFEGTSIYAYHDVTFLDNQMSDSITHLEGPNINIKGMTFTNAKFLISSSTPFGVTASDITINLTNSNVDGGLAIWNNPVHLTNVTINGAPALRAITGGNVEGNIFDNLTVTGYNSTYGLDLPLGTYNNCVFKGPSDEGKMGPGAGKSGKYIFNKCSFTGNTGLSSGNVNLDLTITDSTFNILGNMSAISVDSARMVDIKNNILVMSGITKGTTEIIKLNDYWQRNDPNDILNASISNNTITSNIDSVGISTIYVGPGSRAFSITNNVLNKAKLRLKSNDITSNNKEL
ncbi:hypothetical protein GC096_14195 [Paenibacillus sp. LMG 31461]|uniref:Right handed beta helix domain-containing protein n=1 Tax=Paenibacillus plantarum TaxID=2654975 RepID=A0ABX1X9X7_9BACL|nr:right-handed parallel beta-helix repeat-containing protein [Paenibacillus plantarum]NOU65186.1 hypothetical protein [Paenibacillus plantarum]